MGDQPQWSPPVMGGMTPRPGITVHAVPRAAMEPARNGRDDRPFEQPHPAEAREPQWSPPVMGGMTMQHSVTVPAVRVAAMEPARNGRDDQHHPHRLAVHRLAAMEPARNGRDDSGSFWIWGANTMPPQWSPPVMGGMTSMKTGASGAVLRAAMEPARNGRDDRRIRHGPVRRHGAAMEPARNGRDDWSLTEVEVRPPGSRNGARP